MPDVHPAGIVDRVDAPALELLAVHCARIAQARHVVAAHGHFARGSAGQVRQHPALRIEREATKLFLMLPRSFGLTAVARARLGLAQLRGRQLVENSMGRSAARPQARSPSVRRSES